MAFVSFAPTVKDRITMPLRLLQVLQRRRVLEPAPLTYLMAFAVGSVLGQILQRTLGWTWWIVALAFVGLTWLGFLVTAFSRRRGLATELLTVVSPKRGVERRQRQMEAIFRSPPMPLYGLGPSWSGLRFIGGIGSSDTGIDTLELGHGDPFDDDSPMVRVEVMTEPDDRRENHFEFLKHEVAREVFLEMNRAPSDLPPEEYPRWFSEKEREFEARGEPNPRRVTIPLDGKPVHFDAFTEGHAGGAVAAVNGLIVKVTTSNIPLESVELVSVEDVAPYIAGSRSLREREPDA